MISSFDRARYGRGAAISVGASETQETARWASMGGLAVGVVLLLSHHPIAAIITAIGGFGLALAIGGVV